MKVFKYLGLIALLCLFSCKPNNNNENEIVQSIDTAVYALAIDSRNALWIGAESGLYRSVENGYEQLNLSDNVMVNALYYDQENDLLWTGTESGLLKITIFDDGIEDDDIDPENLSNPSVISFLHDEDSKFWVGTRKGISLNSGDDWKPENFKTGAQGTFLPAGFEDFAINSIAKAGNDYYFATSGARLYRAFGYDSNVDAFSGASQWSIPYNGYSVTDTMFTVFVDDEGKKWMGGKEGIQIHVGTDPKDQESFTYYYEELPDLYVFTIVQAPNGDIWAGTRQGIAVINDASLEVITEGLPGLKIYAIAFEPDGSAWVGTDKGLGKIEP